MIDFSFYDLLADYSLLWVPVFILVLGVVVSGFKV